MRRCIKYFLLFYRVSSGRANLQSPVHWNWTPGAQPASSRFLAFTISPFIDSNICLTTIIAFNNSLVLIAQDSARMILLRNQKIYAYYMTESEEWLVHYVTHRPHVLTTVTVAVWKKDLNFHYWMLFRFSPTRYFYLNYSTKGKWNRYKRQYSNLSFIMKIKLMRHPDYYVRTYLKALLYYSI